jgi:hypothetical protein
MLQAISSSNASLDAGKWVGGAAVLACLLVAGGRGRPGSPPPPPAAPILYTQHQYPGSGSLGYGYTDPDPGLFFSGFQDAKKN